MINLKPNVHLNRLSSFIRRSQVSVQPEPVSFNEIKYRAKKSYSTRKKSDFLQRETIFVEKEIKMNVKLAALFPDTHRHEIESLSLQPYIFLIYYTGCS